VGDGLELDLSLNARGVARRAEPLQIEHLAAVDAGHDKGVPTLDHVSLDLPSHVGRPARGDQGGPQRKSPSVKSSAKASSAVAMRFSA
jgi:hypothetical protein